MFTGRTPLTPLPPTQAPRKLVWKPTFGTVTLDVSFADRTVKGVTCSPLHATILHHFGEQVKPLRYSGT